MLNMEIASTAENERGRDFEESINHETAVLRRRVDPWIGLDRLVGADSYFASLETAKVLYNVELRFLGVVKTSTKQYPMKDLSEIELQHRGQHLSLGTMNDSRNCFLMALVWLDRERRYFISPSQLLFLGYLTKQ